MNKLQEFIQHLNNHDLDALKNLSIQFVRSQDHIAEYDGKATGRLITAFEMANVYPDKVQDILDYGVATLPCKREEPAATFTAVRNALGLSVEAVAQRISCSKEEILDAENPSTSTNYAILEPLAQLLGIDDLKLSIVPKKNEYSFGARLRTFNEKRTIEQNDVFAFMDAIWVAKTQKRLEKWLNIIPKFNSNCFDKNPNYGNYLTPAWEIGYQLADKTRQCLGIKNKEVYLQEVCENLGIPVIQTELSQNIAGATISADDVRAIVVANDARHRDVFVRRMTLAHELGHLLWDPEERLNDIAVDSFNQIGDPESSPTEDNQDMYIERRANAFAVQFLAPITSFYNKDVRISVVDIMESFGISKQTSIFHAQNKNFELASSEFSRSEDIDRGSWEGKESFLIDIFPVPSVPISRRGLFLRRVMQALDAHFLAERTAAMYLKCKEEDVHSIREFMKTIN